MIDDLLREMIDERLAPIYKEMASIKELIKGLLENSTPLPEKVEALPMEPPPEPIPEPEPVIESKPEPDPPVEPTPESSPEPEPLPQQPFSNRQERRRLERARRRLDKLVQPKGPQPTAKNVITKPRAARSPKLSEPEDTPERLIADKVNGEEVLYEMNEFYGEFTFRDTILDQLDRYFFYLHRMKKSDPEAYAMYHQVGASILPYMSTWIDHNASNVKEINIEEVKSHIKVPSWFHHQRPAFGCFAWGADPKTEEYEKNKSEGKSPTHIPRFFYFRKYKEPSPYVQKAEGDIYGATVWWDNGKRGYGVPQEFFIGISSDGNEVEVLRTLSTERIRIQAKRKNRKFSIPDRRWRIPDEYQSWAKQHGLTPEIHLAHVFCTIMTRHEFSQSAMARVAVKKGDMTAIFCLSPRRMAYFFQDRDITLTDKGSRQRVFHMVKPYSYTTKTGKTVNVKIHFRGLRNFNWAGYDVSITIPGLDHLLFDELNIPMTDEHWLDLKKEPFIGAEKFGKMVSSLPKTFQEFGDLLEEEFKKDKK